MNKSEILDHQRNELLNDLRRKGIHSEPVLKAMGRVPRELFMDENMWESAYLDRALPIDCQQTISQPYTVAYMTQELCAENGEKVLEIGTGSGYQSAILWELGADVYSIERHELLLQQVSSLYEEIGIGVKLFLGDGSLGLSDYAPFDRIIVSAAAPKVPKALKMQLSIGGLMIVPIGNRESQTMTIVQRISKTKFTITKKDNFRFVPLIGEEGWGDDQN